MRLTRPQEHREFLLEAMRGVMDGSVPISAANAIAVLSSEVHSSIEQEWKMRVYLHENHREIEHRPTIMLEDHRDEDV